MRAKGFVLIFPFFLFVGCINPDANVVSPELSGVVHTQYWYARPTEISISAGNEEACSDYVVNQPLKRDGTFHIPVKKNYNYFVWPIHTECILELGICVTYETGYQLQWYGESKYAYLCSLLPERLTIECNDYTDSLECVVE